MRPRRVADGLKEAFSDIGDGERFFDFKRPEPDAGAAAGVPAGFDVFPPCLVHRLHRHDVGVEPLVAAVSPRIVGAAFPDAHGVEVQLRPEITGEKRVKLLFQQGPFFTQAQISSSRSQVSPWAVSSASCVSSNGMQ